MPTVIDLKAERSIVLKAYLIGLRRDGESFERAEGLLEELKELAENIGLEISGSTLVNLREPNPHYLVGTGKFNEIRHEAKMANADIIIFDDAISPAQQRNWEKETQKCVIDRQEVILEIFSRRASTREARLQVELARLEYSLPRLKRAWTHLSRQRGGGVTQRGAGESQLETDRRLASDRIALLKREIASVRRVREVNRKKREKAEIQNIAIVGYTNAGKSSLMNRLAGAEVFAANKLFATLDPTTRKMVLPNGAEILLTDTVGFVRRLPHSFIDAFKSTLEEAVFADMLIHLVDASSPDVCEHIETTKEVLREIGVGEKPTITVFNKIDKIESEVALFELRHLRPDAIETSLLTGEGLDKLVAKMEILISEKAKVMNVLLPHDQYKLLNLLQTMGAIRQQKYEDEGIRISACVPASMVAKVRSVSI